MLPGQLRLGRIFGIEIELHFSWFSFTGPSGVRHSVEVTAESIYEAAALGVSALKSDGWADAIAAGTELEIQREPATCHRITVQQIGRWCDGVAVSPDETLKKRRLKQLLSLKPVRCIEAAVV
jgi:hypothetical protein